MAEHESGSRRPGFLETLREGWKPAGRRSDATNSSPSESPTESKDSEASEAPTATSPRPTAEKPEAKSPATEPAAGPKPAASSIDERMEGIQGWMAELERRQRRTTYFGAIAVVLAAAAAAAALFLAITTPNSASKDDFDDLEAQMKAVQDQVSRATTDQTRLKELNASIEALGARVAASEQKGNQTATDIASLKAQVAQAAARQATTPAPTPTPAPLPTTPGGSKP